VDDGVLVVLIRRLVAGVIFAAMLVAGWTFAHRNGAVVDVDLLALHVSEVKLWLALLAAFAAGALIAGTIGMLSLARAGMVARRYRRTVAGFESEVHELRNLPLASGDAVGSQPALQEVIGNTGTGA
jgi:uncharacterized integral membrane protein